MTTRKPHRAVHARSARAIAAQGALHRLRQLADTEQRGGRAALLLAEMKLAEAVADSDLLEALNTASTAATALLNRQTPFQFFGPIADVLETIAAALRELGHNETADELATAANTIKGVAG